MDRPEKVSPREIQIAPTPQFERGRNQGCKEWEKFLPSKDDLIDIIVDELVKYGRSKRFKLNAKLAGKNWTLANWLAKTIAKRIGK